MATLDECLTQIDYNDPIFKAVQAIMHPEKVNKSQQAQSSQPKPPSYDEAFAAIMNEGRSIKSNDRYHTGYS